jgi:hypothetical protein
MNPAQAIQDVTARFAPDTPYEINNGCCAEWANEVFSALHDSEHAVEYWETPFGVGDTEHAFLKINGKFYDAECPQGTTDPMELPIFSKLPNPQPVWRIDHNGKFNGPDKYHLTTEQITQYNKDFGIE